METLFERAAHLCDETKVGVVMTEVEDQCIQCTSLMRYSSPLTVDKALR